MEYTITLPNDHPRTTIRELLEQEWLVLAKYAIYCEPAKCTRQR